MLEQALSVVVTVSVETTKATYLDRLELDEHGAETIEEFLTRVRAAVEGSLP